LEVPIDQIFCLALGIQSYTDHRQSTASCNYRETHQRGLQKTKLTINQQTVWDALHIEQAFTGHIHG